MNKNLLNEVMSDFDSTGTTDSFTAQTDPTKGFAALYEKYKDKPPLGQQAKELALDISDRSYLGSAVKYGQRRLQAATAGMEFEQFEKEYNPTFGEEPMGMPDWDQIKQMGTYIKDNPGDFAKDLGKSIAADPWLLGIPAVFGSVFKAATGVTSKVGPKVPAMGTGPAAAAGATAEAGVAGGIGAAGEAMQSLEQTGQVDPGRVAFGAGAGGAMGLAIGGGQAVFKVVKNVGDIVESSKGFESSLVQSEIYDLARVNHLTLQEATEQIAAKYGLDGSEFVKDINRVGENLIEEATGEYHPLYLGPRKEPQVKVALGDDLWETAAYRPNGNPITKPIVTLQEFKESFLGKSKSGKPLGGIVLQRRWEKFHRDIMDANGDRSIWEGHNVTKQELMEIMAERSPTMREFFLRQSRKKGSTRDTKTFTRAVGYGEQAAPRVVKTPHKSRLMFPEQATAARAAGGKIDPEARTPIKPPQGPPTPPSGKRLPDVSLKGTSFGAASLAAVVGYANGENPVEAIQYAAIAGGGMLAGAKVLAAWAKANPVLRELTGATKPVKFNDLLADWQGGTAVYERKLLQIQKGMYEATGGKIKGANLRKEITAALEAGTVKSLPENAQVVAKMVEEMFADAAKILKGKGLIEDAIENYVSHFWQHPTRSNTELLRALFEDTSGKIPTKTIHEKTRVVPTYAHGIEKGLVPLTTDIAEILPLYLKHVQRADANNKLITSLKKLEVPGTKEGVKVVMAGKKVPKSYIFVDHPKLAGNKVHPDVAEAVKSMVGSSSFGTFFKGMSAINFWFKRTAVSLSGFHAKALLMSSLMAGGLEKGLKSPIKSTADLIKMFQGKSMALEALYSSSDTAVSRSIDQGLRNGLVINMVDDVGKDTFYESLHTMQNVIDKIGDTLPIFKPVTWMAGKTVKGIENLNVISDAIMWDRIYTSAKLTTYMDKMKSLGSKYGGKINDDELARMAAEFTNDAFGGLNWLRLAEGVENKYASGLAYKLASGKGRQWMQMTMFAPDWTTANARVFYRGFINKNPVQRRLYQAYLARGLLMWGVMADGVNKLLTGHHMWDNKDPTTLEFSNGQAMVLSKQFWEPYKWMVKAQQSALNKASSVAHIGAEALTGKQWVSGPGSYAPPIEDFPSHFGKKFLPIWGQQMTQDGIGSGLSSAMGFPIKGQPGGLEALGRSSGSR